MSAPPPPPAQPMLPPSRPVLALDDPTKHYIENLVKYSYKRDVSDTVHGRLSWRRWSNAAEAASKLLAGASTVLAFAAGVYSSDGLSFAAGSLGTVSLVCMTLAAYAARESRERTDQLNAVLEHVGVAPVPDLSVDSGDED